ncbi:hypothetical protein [Peterkaempfera griseoplana]|uniref:hypothetical protein n=1 Tax=Peterkaempfera griseoplana TaxID=66896 RepID=UPI0012FF466C
MLEAPGGKPDKNGTLTEDLRHTCTRELREETGPGRRPRRHPAAIRPRRRPRRSPASPSPPTWTPSKARPPQPNRT